MLGGIPSDMIFHYLPFHYWTRMLRALSWSAHELAIGFSIPSNPSCFIRSADRLKCAGPPSQLVFSAPVAVVVAPVHGVARISRQAHQDIASTGRLYRWHL